MPAASSSEPKRSDEYEPSVVLGHLASTVVHQIINAFSTIVSQAEILKATSGTSKSDVATRADAMIRAALSGSAVARKLADHSRALTAVGPNGEAERLDLSHLAAERAEVWRRRSGPNVEIRANLTEGAEMLGLPSHLRIMLDCLIANAVESLPGQGGLVTITTIIDPYGWLALEIRDNGCGMTDETLQLALEPFFTTKPDRPGLGLALARGVWRSHRGAFSIESNPGRGTLVHLTRPTLRVESAEAGAG